MSSLTHRRRPPWLGLAILFRRFDSDDEDDDILTVDAELWVSEEDEEEADERTRAVSPSPMATATVTKSDFCAIAKRPREHCVWLYKS